MLNILVQLALEDLQIKMGGVDIYTEDFFFKELHAKQRSEIALLHTKLGRRSYLSLLIREGMNSERRKIVFHSSYSLGNKLIIPSAICSLEKLADELLGGSRYTEASDAFSTIKVGILKITNKTYTEHAKNNKSKALKVVHTLYKIMKSGHQSVFQLFAMPKHNRKYSMSFRDAYSYEKNKEQSWFISDLKSYFSAELSAGTFVRITSTFEELIPWTNELNILLENSIGKVGAERCGDEVSNFRKLTDVVRRFEFKSYPKRINLDKVMYSHICSLESAHFLVGYPQVIKLAIPDKKLIPIMHEILAFEQKIKSICTDAEVEFELIIPLKGVIEFSCEYLLEIKSIVEMAMGEVYSDEYILSLGQKALDSLSSFHFLKGSNISAVIDQSGGVDLLDIITSYCSILITESEQPKLKPYWSGQASQGGSLKESTKPFAASLNSLTENAPEEHRLYLVTRFEWCRYALRGIPELVEQIYDFRSATANLALKICSTNCVDSIERTKEEFLTYINNYLVDNDLTPILASEVLHADPKLSVQVGNKPTKTH